MPLSAQEVIAMYCPQCGVQVQEGGRVCPNGHALQPGAPEVAVRAGEVARGVVSVLGASAPHPKEVRAVVVSLKVAAVLFALFTVVGLLEVDVGARVMLVGLIGGFTASTAIYGFALIVQAVARTGTKG